MERQWTIEIPIKTKRAKIIFGFLLALLALCFVWFFRIPVPASDIKVNEVKIAGSTLIFDGSFKHKNMHYKSYSIKTYGSGIVVLKLNGGFIGGPQDIHIEAKAMKSIREVYLYPYTPGQENTRLWPRE